METETMRRQCGYILKSDLIVEVNALAARIGCSHSALAELLLKGGMARTSEETLQAWALKRRTEKDPPPDAGSLEGAVLGQLTTDWRRFDAMTLRGAQVTWRTLFKLRTAGLVECNHPLATRLEMKIPASQWRLTPPTAP